MRGTKDKKGKHLNNGIIHRANVEPWSDLFQHLRRCCRTQLLNEKHPPHAVSRWLGHGDNVGDDHYTILTEDLFDRVTGRTDAVGFRRAAESAAVSPGKALQRSEMPSDDADNRARKNSGDQRENADGSEFLLVVRGGIEPPTHGFSVHCSTN